MELMQKKTDILYFTVMQVMLYLKGTAIHMDLSKQERLSISVSLIHKFLPHMKGKCTPVGRQVSVHEHH